MKENSKVIKSIDPNGNEVISILDDDGGAMSLTMESVFEARDLEELDATNILTSTEVESLKDLPPKPSRLEVNNAKLVDKTTGKKYVIKYGGIPKLSDRIARDITASMLTVVEEGLEDDESNGKLVMVPYKKDGTIPDTFNYTIEGVEND